LAVHGKEAGVIRWLVVVIASLLAVSCEYQEVKREVGYKGKARMNPWLAAERFSERLGHQTRSLVNWRAPEAGDAVWFVPAVVLNNRSYVRQAEEWTAEGGHLVLLIQHADASIHDWTNRWLDPEFESPFKEFLARADLKLDQGATASADQFHFDGRIYQVNSSSDFTVTGPDGNKPLVSVPFGDGRITVIPDARIFRNRWIDEKEHADLLAALVTIDRRLGNIVFMRGMDLSLWEMVLNHLWTVLLALVILVLLWLWKNLARFGPVESAQPPSELRGYERHLEALGDFQWRIDRGSSLLAPLRAQILELGQRASQRAGCGDLDFFQFLGDRAGLPRERVFRAMAEAEPADAPVLARTTADLQKLLQVLRHPSLP
jgi:hypothetical protein